MKAFLTTLLIACLVAGMGFAGQAQTTTPAVQLVPVSLGAEWTGANGFLFATTCFSPKSGGLSCVYFPNGAKIHGFSFLTSSKKGELYT